MQVAGDRVHFLTSPRAPQALFGDSWIIRPVPRRRRGPATGDERSSDSTGARDRPVETLAMFEKGAADSVAAETAAKLLEGDA